MSEPTLGDLLAAAIRRLAAAGVPTPDVDAEWLLRSVTGLSHSQLVLRRPNAAPAGIAESFDDLIGRREQREPLQLLLGTVGFRYLELEVRRGVFIPRPETEVLAGEAVRLVPAGGVVVEPCTGTGAIACAVALESRAATVVATDTSAAAVDLARANARRTGARIAIEHGDLLEPVDPALRGFIDVLVCNPPYLSPDDLRGRDPEVVEWDPVEALVSGPSGHEITDRLIAAAPQWLRPGGWLLMEIDSARAGDVAARAAASGLGQVEVVRDLTGADRIVVARNSG